MEDYVQNSPMKEAVVGGFFGVLAIASLIIAIVVFIAFSIIVVPNILLKIFLTVANIIFGAFALAVLIAAVISFIRESVDKITRRAYE